MKILAIVVLSAIVPALAGCADPDRLAALATRDAAMSDFRCARHDISIQETAPMAYHATGCGSAADYVCREEPNAITGPVFYCNKQ